MGIDYFLINDTRKEYVWLARLNAVYDWNLLNEQLNKDILEDGFSLNLLDDIQWAQNDDILEKPKLDILSIKVYHRYRRVYKTLQKYIKGCKCYIMPDTDPMPDFLVNNLFIENEIFNEAGFISDLCEMMQ